MHIRIIGGSDAGISAALRAREIDGNAEISVFLADDFPNFSICGLPFFLSGETPDWRSLAHRTEFDGFDIHRSCPVKHIDIGRKQIVVQEAGRAELVAYDKLVVATGAVPLRPSFEGNALPGVYELHTMEDSFQVRSQLDRDAAKSAIIIGAGYIGVEMADALTHRGMTVTLVERSAAVFPSVDGEFGDLIEETLRKHGVEVVTGAEVASIETTPSGLLVTARNGWRKTADLVLLVVGVKPASDLARDAGIAIGKPRRNSRKYPHGDASA